MDKKHQVKCKRKITNLLKESRHILLSKENQLNKVKKEDDDIEEIIKKIENEHIITFHDVENRTTSLEYSSDSNSQTQDHQESCEDDVSQPPRIKTEVDFLAKAAMPPEDSSTIKQTHNEKQEQDNNEMEEQLVSTEVQDALERIQEEIFTVEDINNNEEQVMLHISIHKGTLDQSDFREWATDTALFLKDKTDYSQYI